MIEPIDGVLRRFDRMYLGQARPAEHDHVHAQRPCRGNLAVGGQPAAVLGDDDFDTVLLQQRTLVVLAERAARYDICRMRHVEWRFDWIDAADEVIVFRSGGEGADLLTADSEENAARRVTQHGDCGIDILHVGPPVAGARRPGRPSQGEDRHARSRGGFCRMGRDRRGIGMGSIDQHLDILRGEISRQPLGTAEAADSHRNRLVGRVGRAAGQRKYYLEVGSAREASRQLARLARATEYENIPHAAR